MTVSCGYDNCFFCKTMDTTLNNSFLWLLWLYVAFYGFFTAFCGFLQLCMAFYSFVWLFTALYGFLQLCMAFYSFVWLFTAFYNFLWLLQFFIALYLWNLRP
jgi:hypothetical protein